jgi:SAM-dependent MidA family methyltransferase
MSPETFENFMQRCLHDPQRGYYSRNIRSIGNRGDFTTAPQLSETPAKAIAAWVARAMKASDTKNLIEIGPGLGTLSRQILKHLPLRLRYRTKLHLVESSPALTAHQKDTLGTKAQFHDDIRTALDQCSGNAVIFSNELVDAFPVRLFQRTTNTWQEIALDHSQGYIREILIKPDSLPESSAFRSDFPSSQRIEVHDSYHQWLRKWLPLWKRGEILTIDYGNTSDQLYHHRPMGSLRAYLLHQRLEGPAIYQNPGLQDITADVNFTDLKNWTSPWLESTDPENFADFIRPFSSPTEPDLMEACSHFMCLRQRRHCN